MRAAPAVDHPLARSGFWRGGAGLCTASACAAMAAWAATHFADGWVTTWVLALAGAAAGGFAGWQAGRGRPGHLVWDGQSWYLRSGQGAVEPGSPEVALDWGAWVLLRWHGGSSGWRRLAPRCLPLARQDQPRTWHALRVALHNAQPAGAAP